MKRIVRRVVLAMTVAMLVACMSPAAVSAKTVKVKKAGFTTYRAVADAAARPVGRGTTKVKMPNGGGYLKFTAPVTGAYRFTVSNVTSGRYCCGYFNLMTASGLYGTSIFQRSVPTKGGPSTGLYVASRSRKGSMFLTSRTGTLPLLQGQTVYIYFHFTGSCTFRLKLR